MVQPNCERESGVEGVLVWNLAYNCVPSSSNNVNRGAGKVVHKGTIHKFTPSDGSQL